MDRGLEDQEGFAGGQGRCACVVARDCQGQGTARVAASSIGGGGVAGENAPDGTTATNACTNITDSSACPGRPIGDTHEANRRTALDKLRSLPSHGLGVVGPFKSRVDGRGQARREILPGQETHPVAAEFPLVGTPDREPLIHRIRSRRCASLGEVCPMNSGCVRVGGRRRLAMAGDVASTWI